MNRILYSLAFAAAFMLFAWFGGAFMSEDMHRTLIVVAPAIFVLSLNRHGCRTGAFGRARA